jgi:hypothetical protein
VAREFLNAAERRREGTGEKGYSGHGRRSGSGPSSLELVAAVVDGDSEERSGVGMAMGSEARSVAQVGGHRMVGFNQGCMAASVAPDGSGRIWLQFPTPGDHWLENAAAYQPERKLCSAQSQLGIQLAGK